MIEKSSTFEEMVIRKIGIMNLWLQQKISSTDFVQIVEINTDPILNRYISIMYYIGNE